MMLCQVCGAEGAVIFPGSDNVTAPGGIVIERGAPDLVFCLADARDRGWPGNIPGERQMEFRL